MADISGLDALSQTWVAVRNHARERLAALQDRIAVEGLDLAATENLRGRIQELKDLLALAEPKPAIDTGSEVSYVIKD